MAHRRKNGEGSIVQLPSGTYRAQLSLQGRRITFTAKTHRECQDWIRKTLNQIDDGLTYASTKLQLGDYLSDWLAMKKPIFRPSTWSYYQQLIRTYITPKIGSITLKNLKAIDIQLFYSQLVKQHVGVPTIQKIHKLLHSALATAEETGILIRNPASHAHPPREPFREMQILSADQVSQFLISIKGHKLEALFNLALTSGMRLRELLAVKWDDLDWVQQSLQVSRQLSKTPNTGDMFQPLKTKSSRRSLALGDETIRILRDHYEQQWSLRLHAGDQWVDHGLIFTNSEGGPICASYLRQVFKKQLVSAGIPPVRFHDIRHTNASLLINHGIPPTTVARRLGHSKTSTTLDVHSHLMEGQQRQAAMFLDDLTTPMESHTNYTRPLQPSKNAIDIDESKPEMAENPK
jgi:integrase